MSVTCSVEREGFAVELLVMRTGLLHVSVHSMTPITSRRLQILKATSFPGRVAAPASSREYLPVRHRPALDQCTPGGRANWPDHPLSAASDRTISPRRRADVPSRRPAADAGARVQLPW